MDAMNAIGLASGLLTLVGFAGNSSIALYNTVNSFTSHPKQVRELLVELESLMGVLKSLSNTLQGRSDINISALEHPLLRCGKACEDFEKSLIECSARSGGDRTSFRDWSKWKYMGDGIDGFNQMLASYKSTITIALVDANLQQSTLTADSVGKYQGLINDATADIEARIANLDEKIAQLTVTLTKSDAETESLREVEEERRSALTCLQVCAQLSEHINRAQIRPTQASSSKPSGGKEFHAKVLNDGLRECGDILAQTTETLEKCMSDIFDRVANKSKGATVADEIQDLARLREEWETVRKCRTICTNANNNLNENVSVIDNYSTGDDTIQWLVSNSEKTIHGRNRGFGEVIRQVGGHMDDTSIQQLSRDFSIYGNP